MTRAGAALALAVGLGASARAARAEPIGALIVDGELALSGGGPTQRVGATAIGYLSRRTGGYASVQRVALDGTSGLATIGIAYRAAAARPRLELVVHADLGATWPLAPAIGAGVDAFLWPTRLPVAIVTGVSAHAILDGVADTRGAWSLTLGLGLAR